MDVKLIELLFLVLKTVIPVAFIAMAICLLVLLPLIFWSKLQKPRLFRWVQLLIRYTFTPTLWLWAVTILCNYLGILWAGAALIGFHFFGAYLVFLLPLAILGMYSAFNELFFYLGFYLGMWAVNWMLLFAVDSFKKEKDL